MANTGSTSLNGGSGCCAEKGLAGEIMADKREVQCPSPGKRRWRLCSGWQWR